MQRVRVGEGGRRGGRRERERERERENCENKKRTVVDREQTLLS